jgi:hypothetical protein
VYGEHTHTAWQHAQSRDETISTNALPLDNAVTTMQLRVGAINKQRRHHITSPRQYGNIYAVICVDTLIKMHNCRHAQTQKRNGSDEQRTS